MNLRTIAVRISGFGFRCGSDTPEFSHTPIRGSPPHSLGRRLSAFARRYGSQKLLPNDGISGNRYDRNGRQGPPRVWAGWIEIDQRCSFSAARRTIYSAHAFVKHCDGRRDRDVPTPLRDWYGSRMRCVRFPVTASPPRSNGSGPAASGAP